MNAFERNPQRPQACCFHHSSASAHMQETQDWIDRATPPKKALLIPADAPKVPATADCTTAQG
ncbi:MAG: hypothetical protein ACKOB5_04825, partial [Betaproteobacteria bacterium]